MYFGESEKKFIEHIRRPALPWRHEQDITECGLPAQGHPTITRADFDRKLKDQGGQRAMMSTCVTCYETAKRHPSWKQDPVASLGREVQGANKARALFKRELLALAALVSRHPDEFAELMRDQEEIVPITVAKKPTAAPRTKGKW